MLRLKILDFAIFAILQLPCAGKKLCWNARQSCFDYTSKDTSVRALFKTISLLHSIISADVSTGVPTLVKMKSRI